MQTVPIPDPTGSVVHVYDGDDLAFSLTFAEARNLAQQILLLASAFDEGDDPAAAAFDALRRINQRLAGQPYRTGVCTYCGMPIEYVDDGPDPYWWRHTGESSGEPHPAWPQPRDES